MGVALSEGFFKKLIKHWDELGIKVSYESFESIAL